MLSSFPEFARRIITAVISFDISSSFRSSRFLLNGIPVSLNSSCAPGPFPVTPGMYGEVDHSNALLRGLVAGYRTIPFLIVRSWASLTIC